MPDENGDFKGTGTLPSLPWQEGPEVWVDQSGYFVNEDGEPLSEQDFDPPDE